MIDRLGARLALNLTPADCGVRVDRNIKMRMIMRITVHMS